MKWEEGRGRTGYLVHLFTRKNFGHWFGFDVLLIKYPIGTYISPHRDPYPFRKHYRMNFILPGSEGGEFKSETSIIQTKYFNLFRPDISTHSVEPVTGKRPRYVFSIGWTIWKK